MRCRWSLEELAEQSQKYLTDEGDSRRVQWKPNGRQIRYYSTLGLLDKPDTENGRVVWYGPRHLVQLLAIKRLQLDGLKLSEIQRSLAGATLVELRRLAGLPEEILADSDDSVTAPAPRSQQPFWENRPSPSLGADFQPCWQVTLAPGITLTFDQQAYHSLDSSQRERLAIALQKSWMNHQNTTKENP